MRLMFEQVEIEFEPVEDDGWKNTWKWRSEMGWIIIRQWENRERVEERYCAELCWSPGGVVDDVGFGSMNPTSPQEALDQVIEEVRLYRRWFKLLEEKGGILASLLTEKVMA